MLPIATRMGKPESFERFIIMSNACITHNCIDKLSKIKATTLIIAGGKDKIIGKDAPYQMSEIIPDNTVYIYPDYGETARSIVNSNLLRFLWVQEDVQGIQKSQQVIFCSL
jgi:hypothetical protein